MIFVSLEVQGVKEFSSTDSKDYTVVENDAEADFFSIYGRDEHGFAHCIGNFNSRAMAESIKHAIESGRLNEELALTPKEKRSRRSR